MKKKLFFFHSKFTKNIRKKYKKNYYDSSIISIYNNIFSKISNYS